MSRFAQYSPTLGYARSGGGLVLTDVKITDYTAVVGELVQVDTTVGPSPITVFAPPAAGRVIGDRFGVIVSRTNSLDSSLIRDLNFDLNGGVPAAQDSFPQTSIRVNSFRAVWVVTSLTGGKSGDLPVWTNEDVNDDNQRDLVGKFDGSSLTTANDMPTPIFSFVTGNNLCQMHLSLLARGYPFGPGNHAQFVVDALFWNESGVVTVEWFTFSVANIPVALAGINVDSVSVGSEVFVRVKGLPTTFVVWHVVQGDVRGGL